MFQYANLIKCLPLQCRVSPVLLYIYETDRGDWMNRQAAWLLWLGAVMCWGGPTMPQLVSEATIIAVVEVESSSRWMAAARPLVYLKGPQQDGLLLFGGFNDPRHLGRPAVVLERDKRYLVFLSWREDVVKGRLAPKGMMNEVRAGKLTREQGARMLRMDDHAAYATLEPGYGIYPVDGNRVRMRWYAPSDRGSIGIPLKQASLLLRSLDARPRGTPPGRLDSMLRGALAEETVWAQSEAPTPEGIAELETLLCAAAHYELRNIQRGIVAATKHPSRDVRRAAARAMRLAPENGDGLMALARLLGDSDSGVQAEAAASVLDLGFNAEILRRAVMQALPESHTAFRGPNQPYDPGVDHTPSGREMLIRLVAPLTLSKEAELALASLIRPNETALGVADALATHFLRAPSDKALAAHAQAFAQSEPGSLHCYAEFILAEESGKLLAAFFERMGEKEIPDGVRLELMRKAVRVLGLEHAAVRKAVSRLFAPDDVLSLSNRYLASLLVRQHTAEDLTNLSRYLSQRELPLAVFADLLASGIYRDSLRPDFVVGILRKLMRHHSDETVVAVLAPALLSGDALRFELHRAIQELPSRFAEAQKLLNVYKQALDLALTEGDSKSKVEAWLPLITTVRTQRTRHAELFLWLLMLRYLDAGEHPALLAQAQALTRHVRESPVAPGCFVLAMEAELDDLATVLVEDALIEWKRTAPEAIPVASPIEAMRRLLKASKRSEE